MKIKRWLVITITVVLLFLITLFFLRHVIIGHVFKVSISKKTNQTIAFNIGDVDYNILDNTVTFTNSNLALSNVFVNVKKTIELSEFDFDKIEIEGFSLFRLLLQREVIADRLLVSRPSVWFTKQNNPIPFKEKPQEVFKSLKDHPGILGDLVVIVDEIEIVNGKVDLKSIISDDTHEGSVDFKILLTDFNTSKKLIIDTTRFLFAKEHFVKLSSFDYKMPNGDSIAFDSIVFKTVEDALISYNLRVHIAKLSSLGMTHIFDAQVGEINLSDIYFDMLSLNKELNIDSVAIHNARIQTIGNERCDTLDNISRDSVKNNIFKKIETILINNITIDDVDFVHVNSEKDTIISTNDMDLLLSGVEIDSNIRKGKIKKADFSKLHIAFGESSYFDPFTGMNIGIGDLAFEGMKGIMKIDDIVIIDTAKNKNVLSKSSIGSLFVKGLDINRYLSDSILSLEFELSKPNIYVESFEKNTITKKKSFPDIERFEINRIDVFDGNINFVSPKINLSVKGITIATNELGLKSLKNLHHTNGENYMLNMESINMSFSRTNEVISTGNAILDNDVFYVKDLLFKTHSISQKLNVSLSEVSLDGVNIPSIIDDKSICLDSVVIISPDIIADISLSEKTKKSVGLNLMEICVDNLKFINGNIDLSLIKVTDSIDAIFGFDIDVSNISISDFSNNDWVDNIIWDVNLENPIIRYNNYSLSMKNIVSEKETGLLKLSKIHALPLKMKNLDIKNFDIADIVISGIEYNKLINGDMSDITLLKIDKPVVDLMFSERKDVVMNKHTIIPHFNIEELELTNLTFNFEHSKPHSSTFLSLGDLDINFKNASPTNYVDGLYSFNLTNLQVVDTAKNSYFEIDTTTYLRTLSEMKFENIRGGSIFKIPDSGFHSYLVKHFGVIGMNISQNYPHTINIDSMFMNYADIENVKGDNHNAKVSKIKDVKINLPEVLYGFSVDYFTGNEINFSDGNYLNPEKTELLGLKVEVDDFKIDSTNNNPLNIAKSASVYLGKNNFISTDSLYDMRLGSVSYNFESNHICADSFTYKPRFTSDEFFQKAAYQTDKMDISIDQINVNDFGLEKFIDDKNLVISSVHVDGLSAILYRNKRYPVKPGTYKKMPREALFSVNIPINIDTVFAHNAYIKYREIDKKSLVPGEIFLDNVDLSIRNLRNDTAILNKNPFMVAQLNARLIGEADLDMTATFNLLSDTNDFWVTGSLKKIDFAGLNSMTQNLVGVTISRGNGTLNIPLISGNSYNSRGDLKFKYSDLKIELFDRENATNATGLSGNMASLLLNDIFIKSNNPGFLGKTRDGDVYFRRDTEKSVIAYIWKSTMSGLMSTMGYNNREQRQEKRRFRKMLRDLNK